MKYFPLSSFIPLAVAAFMLMLVAGEELRAVEIGPMTWTPRSDWVNVKSAPYNAAGDGVADDTEAIQAALDVLNNDPYGIHRTVYFPPGTYRISSTLTLENLQRVSLIGSGSLTTIKWDGATGAAMFWPNHVDLIRYVGFVWDGNNTAGCAFEQWASDGNYDSSIRHENESFRNFTQPGTYLPNHDPVPAAAIAGGFYANGAGSLEADSTIFNCKFSNCGVGFLNSYEIFNYYEWLIDQCEFDDCGYGIQFYDGGCYMITNCHFQQSATADIDGGSNVRVHHCTSSASAAFLTHSGGQNVFQDCWIDGWTATAGAIRAVGFSAQNMIFDCTFTNPPAGAQPPFTITNNAGPHNLLLSNNYAPGFANGYGIVNPTTQFSYYSPVPPGLRFSTLTSAAQTFLKADAFVDSTHIIDVSQAPYNAGSYYNDDTAAIQSAIDAAASANNGTIVYFPGHLYRITSTLTASGSNFTLQGAHGEAQLFWAGPDNGTMLSISNPQNVTVQGLYFTPLNKTVAGIKQTGGPTSSITYDEVGYDGYGPSNVGARGVDISNGPRLVLSNLPAGASVYLNHVFTPLTVQNCGAAQIFARWLFHGAIAVSGTSQQTGFLGILAGEGGQTADHAGYNITVDDNQDFVYGDYYNEQTYNNLQMLKGSGVNTGRVTIEGLNVNSYSSGVTEVNVNNYVGRLFIAPEAYQQGGSVPTTFTFAGKNPLDAILLDNCFYDGAPVISKGAGANLIENLNIINTNQNISYLPDNPNPITSKNSVSMALGLDHLRQLEAVNMSMLYSLSTDGPPLASYAFEGDATDMAAAYNGTSTNVTFADGEVGAQSAVFNGSNSYIQANNPVSGNLSIAMWLQTTDVGGTGQWYAGKGLVDAYTAANSSDFGTSLTGGKFSFGVGASDTTLTSTAAVNDGRWHFLVATRDATSGATKIYVDGVLDKSGTGGTGARNASGKIRIGSLQTGLGTSFLNGRLDQVQLYNYALSSTDVSYLYNHSRSFTPLAAYLKLDEPYGGTSADSTGNGVTGIWQNNPVFTMDHPAVISFPDAGSLSFNGTDQFVDLGHPTGLPLGLAPRTISAWAKTNDTTGTGYIASFGSANTDNAMYIGMANGTLIGGGVLDDLSVSNFWRDNNWHLVTLTYDGATARLYFDGILKASGAKNWLLHPNVAYVGQQVNGAARWNGNIDDVRIYNRALTAPEIANLAAGKL